MKQKRIGKQPSRYKFFFLNPYQDVRFSYCPKCDGKTKLRKVPLVIHVEPMQPVALNKTCRYCPACDILIAHQDEVEAQLFYLFSQRQPDMIGSNYLVMGTMERADWQRSRTEAMTPQEMLDSLCIFKQVLDFEPQRYVWMREDE